ncbi:MAG: AI-2E family transporter [Cyanobacteria bacterium CRU_2_1]|nr:AI-2E family transporter [Cyanobacteria bacterium RU_5_0]NJR58649.1 AI-2E family transporter [Cyanobacteria bacterium CRU_2_1]
MKVGWLGILALLVSLYILWRIRQVLLLLLVAIVLATTLNRLVQRLQKFGVDRGSAVSIAILSFFILVTSFIGLVVPPFVEESQKFVALFPEIINEAETQLEGLKIRIPGQWAEDIQLMELLVQQSQPLVKHIFDHVFLWISDLLSIILKLVLVLVLTVMLLANPQQYRQPFIRLFPAFYRSRVNDILTQCETDLGGWMTATFITMVVISLLSGLGLWILGVPLGLSSALWAGFCELIPNIGYIAAMFPPLAIALLDAPWKALPIAGLYFLIQQLESYVIVPWVMKEHVSLPPAITLLSQIVFATFFGVIGLFLALPLVIITKIWIREALVKDVFDQWQQP